MYDVEVNSETYKYRYVYLCLGERQVTEGGDRGTATGAEAGEMVLVSISVLHKHENLSSNLQQGHKKQDVVEHTASDTECLGGEDKRMPGAF